MGRLKKAAVVRKLSGKEKAAIFLLALGCEPSAHVFEHLNSQDVEILSFQIASTEKVDSNTLSQVLYEFRELATARNYIATGQNPVRNFNMTSAVCSGRSGCCTSYRI